MALLAAFHGGEDAVFLHLDDDTPLFRLVRGRLKKNPRDELSLFLKGFRQARANGRVGYGGTIVGVPDAFTSVGDPHQRKRLSVVLKLDARTYSEGHGGSARILSFEGLQVPYKPFGISEDVEHCFRIGFLESGSVGGLGEIPMAMHIGVMGAKSPRRARNIKLNASRNAGLEDAYLFWPYLVEKASKLGAVARH